MSVMLMVSSRRRSPVTLVLVSFVSLMVLGLVLHRFKTTLFREHYPMQLCRHASNQKTIEMVVAVKTLPNNYATRQAIRSSMASPAVRAVLPWQVVFYMGHSLDFETSRAVQREARKGDLIITPYEHHGQNTVKIFIDAIRWVQERCEPNLRYLVHANDSTMVDLVAAHEYVSKMVGVGLSFHCAPTTEVRVGRNVNSSTYLSETQIRDPYFQTFCEGDAFIVSAKYLKRLGKAPEAIPQYLGQYVTGHLTEVAKVGHRNISEKITALAGKPPKLNCTTIDRAIFITNVNAVAHWKTLWLKTLVCYRNQTDFAAKLSEDILRKIEIDLLN